MDDIQTIEAGLINLPYFDEVGLFKIVTSYIDNPHLIRIRIDPYRFRVNCVVMLPFREWDYLDVDWGDGNITSDTKHHFYNQAGVYTIIIRTNLTRYGLSYQSKCPNRLICKTLQQGDGVRFFDYIYYG